MPSQARDYCRFKIHVQPFSTHSRALAYLSFSLLLSCFILIINYIISEARLIEDARPPTKLLLLNTPASLGASNWNNIL